MEAKRYNGSGSELQANGKRTALQAQVKRTKLQVKRNFGKGEEEQYCTTGQRGPVVTVAGN